MNASSEEVRAILIALTQKFKLLEETNKKLIEEKKKPMIFTEEEIGYCLTGMVNMQRFLHSEVEEWMSEIFLQMSKTKLGGEPKITFKQYGRYMRVRFE